MTAAAALGAALFCAWVAAPALSLNPYIPGAVDFQRSLPDAKRISVTAHRGHSHEKLRWISPPVSAPDRFDLVGVAREMRPLEIRARDEGGEWSDWVRPARGHARLRRRRRRGAGPRCVPPRRQAPLRQRQRDHGRHRRPSAERRAPDRQLRADRHRVDPDRRGHREQAQGHTPVGVGRGPAGGRLRAPRPVRGRRHERRGDPPHRQRQRLHAGGGAGHRARDLQLPRERERVERHRLQRPGRPLRADLRGPRRRPGAADRRRPRPGVQRPDDLGRVDRRPHLRADDEEGAQVHRQPARLEAEAEPRHPSHRDRDRHVGRRLPEPLHRRHAGDDPPHRRARDARADRVPRGDARPAGREHRDRGPEAPPGAQGQEERRRRGRARRRARPASQAVSAPPCRRGRSPRPPTASPRSAPRRPLRRRRSRGCGTARWRSRSPA